jgi:diacylglycerol kinase (ATP)
MFKCIHVVINPSSGKPQPVLSVLNSVFQPAGVDWHVHVTQRAGDAIAHTRRAVEAGADVVAAYGGDGTVMEVATALRGTGVPLAIFPGGTANVMSYELGISSDLAEACALVCGDAGALVPVDMGEVEGHGLFILRVGAGVEADMVAGATPEAKERMGNLAYAISALQALNDPPHSRYRLTLDGETFESEGVTCVVCNSGSLGRMDLTFSPNISVRDGLLDVIVLRQADLLTALSLIKDVLSDDEPSAPALQHWQARDILVETDPPVTLQGDGEVWGKTPFRARVVPSAVQVVVPRGE